MAEYQVLITGSGTHSAEKWAVATAKQIFPIADANLTGDNLVEAHRCELALIELLAKHHGWHQDDEQGKLRDDPKHVLSPMKTEDDAKSITSLIIAIMDGSPWQDHFSNPEVQTAIQSVIESHTLTNRSVERSWHADRNEHCEYARKYREAR